MFQHFLKTKWFRANWKRLRIIILCIYVLLGFKFWPYRAFIVVLTRINTPPDTSFVGLQDVNAPVQNNLTIPHSVAENALSKLSSFTHSLITKTSVTIAYPAKSRFKVPISMVDSVKLQQIFRVFDAAMTSVNVSYFIIGGTLLGSYRNHGKIPWDDDGDVIFNNSDASTVKQVLSNFDPRFQVYAPDQIRKPYYMKFYPTDGHQLTNYPYRSAFIDIYIYKENDTHLINMSPNFGDTYAKQQVFPLVWRPFGELLLPAPCNPRKVMESNGINISMCRTHNWNHIVERGASAQRTEVPCVLLSELYPFVHRETLTNLTDAKFIETLVLGNLVLRQVSIEGSC